MASWQSTSVQFLYDSILNAKRIGRGRVPLLLLAGMPSAQVPGADAGVTGGWMWVGPVCVPVASRLLLGVARKHPHTGLTTCPEPRVGLICLPQHNWGAHERLD
jgi:hypothetical protein